MEQNTSIAANTSTPVRGKSGRQRAALVACGLLLLTALAGAFGWLYWPHGPAVVLAERETEPVSSEGDAADDPCIWVHPTDARQSLIVGTDKQRGLMVYDLEGKLIQELSGGEPNNVDNRSGFTIGRQSLDIFVAGDRKTNALAFWSIDPETRRLSGLGEVALEPEVKVYGSCLYCSRRTGDWYVFITSKDGDVQQWQIDLGKPEDVAAPTPQGKLVRRLKVGTQTEGCVADDELGWLYVGEEDEGIWRFDAEPDGSTQPEIVDRAGPKAHLVPDVEGLALYRGAGGTGYLLASSQGSSMFCVYERRPPNKFLGCFSVGKGRSIDEVTKTDGIEVTAVNLGAPFAEGLFVAQDDKDDSGDQNFKLVPWKRIAAAFQPELDSASAPQQPADAAK